MAQVQGDIKLARWFPAIINANEYGRTNSLEF